jgi:propionyl-CoA synthetase
MSLHQYDYSIYDEAYKKSLESPDEFWSEVAGYIDWSKPWHKVLDNSNAPFTKW